MAMKKNKLAGMSLRELKTWLDGYCSALGEDWSPSAEQWKMIKDKIFSLDELEEKPKSMGKTGNQPIIPIHRGPIIEVPNYYGPDFDPPPPMSHEVLPQPPKRATGLTNKPAFVQGKDGALRMPDGEAGETSGFA